MLVVLLALGAAATAPTSEQLLREARTALRARNLGEAARLCRAAAKAGEEVETARALRLCAKVERTRKRPREAEKLTRAALFAAPSQRSLRARLRADWRRALRRAKREGAPAQRLAKADAVIDRAAARPKRPPRRLESDLEALGQAIETVRQIGDRRRAAFATVLRHHILSRSGEPERALRGLRKWTKHSNRSIRRRARRVEVEASLATKAFERAAVAAARRRLDRADRPDGPLRPDALLQKACRAWGREACARQIHKTTGVYLMTDHSRRKPARQRPPALMETLHAEATVALMDCLLAHARADKARFAGARLELSWVVDPNGRARAPELRPRRYRDLIEGCVSERLSWLRYPRLVGRQSHETVSIPFAID